MSNKFRKAEPGFQDLGSSRRIIYNHFRLLVPTVIIFQFSFFLQVKHTHVYIMNFLSKPLLFLSLFPEKKENTPINRKIKYL